MDEDLFRSSPLTECISCISHALLTKESLYGKLPFHALSGEGNDYKYELTAMQLYNDKHTPTYAQKREGAICLPEQT